MEEADEVEYKSINLAELGQKVMSRKALPSIESVSSKQERENTTIKSSYSEGKS